MRSPRPATRADVAAQAGVSLQTVTRVVHDSPHVSEATRDRVHAAMAAVGYSANTAARALATGRFGSVGIVASGLDCFGNIRTVDAITRVARSYGYATTFATVTTPNEHGLRRAVQSLADQSVDGVVVIEATALDAPEVHLPTGVPVVMADRGPHQTHHVVDIDQAAGARLAVEHLLGLGHRTVHHVTGPAGSHAAARRSQAWREALLAAGRPVPAPVAADWTSRSGYRAGLALAGDPAVNAVFAANDQVALGVVRALHEAGRDVPGDVSVVGFDDIDEAGDFWPPLTTVRQDLDRVGTRCVELLVALMGGAETPTPHSEFVTPELVVRRSTAPPRQG
ncbi:LacI family DNA-binding transcriptional regulator [Jannaschia sp. R86511]|uniref:LacI family DNA-binding transcriptional regulator n=1 Tax=Jannaschia sp. R86511 TaxID=3093853 RepID=UPI0036D3D592